MSDIALETQTPPDPPAPAAVRPPTPDEVDDWIERYDALDRAATTADIELKAAKQHIIFLVDSFGQVPAHAEASIRLTGRHHQATVTRGTTVSVDEKAVDDLETYLDSKNLLGLFPRFFVVQTSRKLVEGAHRVLKTVEIPRRVSEQIASLFGRSFEIKAKSPALKIEKVKAEKPAKQPRGGKAAA